VFGHDHGQPFLGREFSAEPDYSDDVAREIDDEIRRIVEEAHQVARDILSKHRQDLDHTSDILMRRETIEREQFIDLLARKSEDHSFGAMERVRPPTSDEPVEPEPKRKPSEGPRPLPRPGLAAEMRADDAPEKPSL